MKFQSTENFNFISEPKSIPFYLLYPIKLAEKVLGKKLLPARLLSYFPKAAISSFIFEALVVNRHKNLNKRLLKLIRIQASLTASCPFCIDMNSVNYKKCEISKEELLSLQDEKFFQKMKSFTIQERLAIRYAKSLTNSPIKVSQKLFSELKINFSESEIVALSYTIAQVNFWTRLIQGLKIQPEGFSKNCVFDLNKFNKSKK